MSRPIAIPSPETPQHHRFLALPVLLPLLLAASLATTTAVPTGAQPPVTVDLSEEAITELPIGSALLVEWNGGVPEEPFTVTLLDELATTITSVEVAADGSGVVPPSLLWWGTGVVGCDEGAMPQPTAFRFERYEEAREILVGRTFKVRANDAEDNLLGEVSIALVPPPTFYYFSDGSACPRSNYHPSETLYLSTSNGGNGSGSLGTFVLEPTDEIPCFGDEIYEFRDQYQDHPQQLPKQPGASFVVLGALADGADVVDPYGCRELWAVVRPQLVSDDFDLRNDDLFVHRGPVIPCLDLPAPSWAHSGATVDPWKPDDFGPCPPDED